MKFWSSRDSYIVDRYSDHSHWAVELDVTMFFVLSGFLISFILLQEKQGTGNINLGNFYKRRILKIWPLYYLILIIGFFVLPYFGEWFYHTKSDTLFEHFWVKFILALLFLPPILGMGKGKLPLTMATMWSVRVEEFFYLFWPLLLKRSKNFIKLCIAVIMGYVGLKLCIDIIIIFFKNHLSSANILRAGAIQHSIGSYQVSAMAIGAIGAHTVISKKTSILSFLYRRDVQWVVYIIMAVMLIYYINVPLLNVEVFSVLFTIVILNLATNPNSILYLEYKWMKYMGRTAYGIYLYNSITRAFSLQIVESIYRRELAGWQMEIMYYSIASISVLIVAIISYEFFEKPFLRLKDKYTIVKTT